MILPLVESDAIDVIQRSALCRSYVIQNGARRRSRSGFTSEPKTLERQYAEMIFEQRNGMVRREHPIVERRLGKATAAARWAAGRARAPVPTRSFELK